MIEPKRSSQAGPSRSRVIEPSRNAPLKLPSPREWLARAGFQPAEASVSSTPQRGSPRFLIATDFDGTLVEIASTPEGVRFPETTRKSLKALARRLPTLICTGRSLVDLSARLGNIPGLDLIANHGAELREWDSGAERFVDRAVEHAAWDAWRRDRLPTLVQAVNQQGGALEDKGHSVTLHFRTAGREYWSSPTGRRKLEQALAPGVMLLGGLMAWNLVPEGVSKGAALGRFCQERGIRHLIYFGDEETDETVFRLTLPSVQIDGVKVGQGETAARYRVAQVEDVRRWLDQLSSEASGLR